MTKKQRLGGIPKKNLMFENEILLVQRMGMGNNHKTGRLNLICSILRASDIHGRQLWRAKWLDTDEVRKYTWQEVWSRQWSAYWKATLPSFPGSEFHQPRGILNLIVLSLRSQSGSTSGTTVTPAVGKC